MAMRDTADVIEKMQEVMDRFDAGTITGPDARTYVAMLRTMLDAKKVEAAFIHMGVPAAPAVPLISRSAARARPIAHGDRAS